MKRRIIASIFACLPLWFFASCANGILGPTFAGAARTFTSGYESESDFAAFFRVPHGDYDSDQEYSGARAHSGTNAHHAWILKARAEDNDGVVYLPHRAYPTIQLQKTTEGIYRTPCLVTLWVYLDITLNTAPKGHIDDWFSFITLSPDASDSWTRTVVVNLTPDGYIKLVHVPHQGQQDRIYQVSSANDPTGALLFPQRQWVRLDTYINFDAVNGYAKVWQNGVLVSHAKVSDGLGGLAQAHFGLYAAARLAQGEVWNDDLRIIEVANEAEAQALVDHP